MVSFHFLHKPWKIYQKIGYGYGVAIAIGVVGSVLGMVIADYFQGQGVARLADAQFQSQLLKDFEQEAETFQLYSTRLSLLDVGSQRFTSQSIQMQARLHRIESLHQDIELFLESEPSWLAVPPETLSQFIHAYTQRLIHYNNEVQRLVPPQAADASAAERAGVQQQLQALATGDEARAIDTSHMQLLRVMEKARAQERRAGEELETAQGWEKLIIMLSITGSATIAGMTAWRTTVAIARPLETLTQVAQQAAQQSNFEVQVPVTSNDEIGTLGRSFNALIEQVSQRTKALEQSVSEANYQAEELEKTLAVLRRTQTQLVQTEKMSSLGQMVAGIAHEINNPVSFIYGNINYVEQYVKDLLSLVERYEKALPHPPDFVQTHREAIDLEFLRHDLPKLLASLNMGAERIRSIVLSLRIFSRLDEADFKSANIHEGLDSTLVILGSRLKAQRDRPEIKVTKDYATLPLIDCHPGHLNQVFMNILANAIDALDERYIQERTTNDNGSTHSEWQPTIHLQTEQVDHQIYIHISDNGMGMPKTVQEKIFDPFFTTKPVGKGTGLGMSIRYEIIVKKHLGSISISSIPGQGTTFHIQLPLKRSDRPTQK